MQVSYSSFWIPTLLTFEMPFLLLDSIDNWILFDSIVTHGFMKILVNKRAFYLRIILIDDLSILSNLLLSWKHAIEELDSIVAVIEVELPMETHFWSKR